MVFRSGGEGLAMNTNEHKSDRAWHIALWAGGITACVNLALVLVFTLGTHSWSADCDTSCQEFIRDTVVVRGRREGYNDKLVRWKSPIRIAVFDESKDHPIELDPLFQDIVQSTGHDISGGQDGKINFIIFLTDNVFATVGTYDKFFEKLFTLYGKKEGQSSFTFLWDSFDDNDPCFGLSIVRRSKTSGFGFRHAMIFADFSKNHEDVERCLLQKTIRFLGIYDADKDSTDSVVSLSPSPAPDEIRQNDLRQHLP